MSVVWGAWALEMLESEIPDLRRNRLIPNQDVFKFRKVPGGNPVLGVWAFGIPVHSTHANNASAFIHWINEWPRQLESAVNGNPPLRLSLLSAVQRTSLLDDLRNFKSNSPSDWDALREKHAFLPAMPPLNLSPGFVDHLQRLSRNYEPVLHLLAESLPIAKLRYRNPNWKLIENDFAAGLAHSVEDEKNGSATDHDLDITRTAMKCDENNHPDNCSE